MRISPIGVPLGRAADLRPRRAPLRPGASACRTSCVAPSGRACPCATPSICTTGASVQHPRHGTGSSVTRRSASVSASAAMPKCRRSSSRIRPLPPTWHAVPQQTFTRCSPTGVRRNCV